MPLYTFDTSFIIANKLSEFPGNFVLSEIVILELPGSASDESTFKALSAVRRAFAQCDLLMTPNSDDWLITAKSIEE
jgi:hypothetical protein